MSIKEDLERSLIYASDSLMYHTRSSSALLPMAGTQNATTHYVAIGTLDDILRLIKLQVVGVTDAS